MGKCRGYVWALYPSRDDRDLGRTCTKYEGPECWVIVRVKVFGLPPGKQIEKIIECQLPSTRASIQIPNSQFLKGSGGFKGPAS